MELKELQYQVDAITAITSVFEDVPLQFDNTKANPFFDYQSEKIQKKLKENIDLIQQQNGVKEEYKTCVDDGALGIDVKMETGTGKTYVYSRLMLELHSKYKFNKFIIITPTTPIKEGTKAFISSKMFKDHFTSYPEYSNSEIVLEILDSRNAKKNKGRKYFPSEVRNFSEGDSLARNTINVLLTGMGMLKKGKTQTLDRSDYDETLFSGVTRPVEALAETRPIVILDEAHKFPRDKKTYKYIMENLKPLVVLRFGATFPELEGKKDYNNLIFNLTAAQAFNNDLVKGVSVYYPRIPGANKKRFKLVGISSQAAKSNKKIRFRDEDTKKVQELSINDSLSVLHEEFSNITIADIGKFEETSQRNSILLSNDRIVEIGDSLYPGIFSKTYQQIMIDQSIELHFKKEKENFYRVPRYKTLALFFIDRVESYRDENNNLGYLGEYFEESLKRYLEREIKDLNQKENKSAMDVEYEGFLNASLSDISLTHGGYFSKDNQTSDEAIKIQVNEILKDKESLLAFKKSSNNWNTRRFIFSKWTLREGWDNPNIFTIAKLRSSGSENSKLQEVGRGLRLPVDEFGKRAEIGEDDFRLNYLVDHTEEKFAEDLLGEINKDVDYIHNIQGLIPKVASKLGITVEKLLGTLLINEYIDADYNIIEDNREIFYEAYPDFRVGLKKDKVTKEEPEKIKIRKENFEAIRELWEKINQNYMIKFDSIPTELLEEGISQSLIPDVFRREHSSFIHKKMIKDSESEHIIFEDSLEEETFYVDGDKINYGEFLKKTHTRTNLPINLIHLGIVKFNQRYPEVEIYPTNRSVDIFVLKFEEWFIENFEGRYNYIRLEGNVRTTALTDDSGEAIETVTRSRIGVHQTNKSVSVPEKYLYDQIVFDSPLEETNIIESEVSSVEVYGKIPKSSIRVPLFFGGTTSPDFMYIVNKEDGTQSVNMILETKDVERTVDIRSLEQKKINASKKFFDQLTEEGYEVKYMTQLKRNDIRDILEDLTS